jgi:hypothetical protein
VRDELEERLRPFQARWRIEVDDLRVRVQDLSTKKKPQGVSMRRERLDAAPIAARRSNVRRVGRGFARTVL